MIIEDNGISGIKGYYSYKLSDFSSDYLSDLLRKIVEKLESKNITAFEASEAYYEDKYPRLYMAIKEDDKIIDNILELEDFDI